MAGSARAAFTRRHVLRLVGLGAAAALGSACQIGVPPGPEAPTPSPAPTPQPTAPPTLAIPTMRIAIDVDPDTLDPAGQTSTTVQNIVDYVSETLVRLQPDGTLGPGLATHWEQSPDGRTYTFTLRENVRFHDGSDLTADTVKRSLERFLNPRLKVPLRAGFDPSRVDAVLADDRSTLRIMLRERSRLFLAKLAGTEMAIVSQAHARSYPDAFNEEPVGTGPYRFRERRKGESILLERFEGYWGKRPYFQFVQFRIVPEAATRESLLLANQVEMIIQPPLSDLPALQRSGSLNVLLPPTSRSIFVAMDVTYPGGTPLSIKRVRQALNHAVDRDSIIRNVLFGAATPMDAPMAPSLFGYTRTGPYSYDPARARQLLLDAGTPGLSLKFIHPAGRTTQEVQATQVAQAIAGNLHDVGVAVELNGYEWASYLAAINVPEDRGVAHMHLFGWAPAFLDAAQQMTQFSRSQWPPQGLASSHYSNPRVEALLDRAAREPDPQKWQDQYAEAQRIVWDDAPWIFLWVPSFPIVHTARLRNISSLPVEKFVAVYAEP